MTNLNTLYTNWTPRFLIVSKVLGREVQAVAIPENQWLEIMKTFNSQRNAEAMYEMSQGLNTGFITFETENPIEGKVTIEDYAGRALK